MLSGLSDAIAAVLAWFYSLVPSYGLAIIMLTVAVMVVLTPLTLKGTRSMMEMQRLQPELKRIQAKHKGDREKLNQEMMAFYKEHNINPLGGCLPLLVQMPVFIILFQVLRGLTNRCGGLGSGTGSIAAQADMGESLQPWVSTDQFFCPDNLNTDTAMYQDLNTSTSMDFLGIDLSLSASNALQQGVAKFLPYLVLILIVLVSSIVQQRQIQGRQSGSQVSSQQQAIMKFMPYLLPVFSFGFSAGLVLYFVVSNLYRIGQQGWITRSMHAQGLIDTTAKEKSVAKGGGKDGAGAKGKQGAGGAKGKDGAGGKGKDGAGGAKGKDGAGGKGKQGAGGKGKQGGKARSPEADIPNGVEKSDASEQVDGGVRSWLGGRIRKGRGPSKPVKRPGSSAKSQAVQRKENQASGEPNKKGTGGKGKPSGGKPSGGKPSGGKSGSGQSRTRSGQPRSKKKKKR